MQCNVQVPMHNTVQNLRLKVFSEVYISEILPVFSDRFRILPTATEFCRKVPFFPDEKRPIFSTYSYVPTSEPLCLV